MGKFSLRFVMKRMVIIMFLKCLKVGQLETNCYILYDKPTNKAAVIDPGFDAQRIASTLDEIRCKAEYIILTHAHFDHITAAHELIEKTGAKLAVFETELSLLNDPSHFRRVDGSSFKPFTPEILLHDGDILKLGTLNLTVMHTPGHTQGSCSIICEDSIFSGDTLFKEEVGRTDLVTGSYSAIINSVNRLAALDGDYKVYPGHGDSSTLSHERKFNPYLNLGDTV